jgi:hypothetical protein
MLSAWAEDFHRSCSAAWHLRHDSDPTNDAGSSARVGAEKDDAAAAAAATTAANLAREA